MDSITLSYAVLPYVFDDLCGRDGSTVCPPYKLYVCS